MHSRGLFRSLVLAIATAQATTALSDAFDVREATIDSVHNALFTGLTTCKDIISSYIARIEAYNPTINAMISLNPNALTIADQMDMQLAAGNATGPLFCVAVLAKDNYDTAEMNTTGGCLDLAGNKPTADAPVIAALKNAGAIILGKTNLHELALEGLTVSSLGGQTLNAYDQSRTPGGSSGGTGAAIASNFGIFGLGTDTVNSLRSPASAGSLVSCRPTRGRISRYGVIPISVTQDAIGPIARTIKDLARALTVMASLGFDARDNSTALISSSALNVDFGKDLYSTPLKGLRFGLIEGFFNFTDSNETTPVNVVMADMVTKLTAAGATVIPINSTIYDSTAISANFDVQTSEYRQDMNTYLADPVLSGIRPANFTELYSSGKFLVIPSQYGYLTQSLASSTSNASYAPVQLGIQNLTVALRETFSANSLDALIYPEQKNLVVKVGSPSQSGRNGILAAVTGSPVVCVPAGFSNATTEAPIGVPIGMEILGMPWTEKKLLAIAAQIEVLTKVRRMPAFANGTIEAGVYSAVPSITPNNGNIPSVYPIGVI